ncbi:MAG: hypothetical protein JNJ58_12760 [Chitinophagaceae bacterium]|nr:hypothetical protein [Chitinophagaceae bacterium]
MLKTVLRYLLSIKLNFLFVTGMCLILSINSIAQTVNIKAQSDSNRIRIGSQFIYTLSAEFNPQQYKVQFPTLSDTFNHFEVVTRGKSDTLNGRELQTIRQSYTLTNFDSGRWTLPAVQFDVSPIDGSAPYSLSTEAISIQVQTLAIDTTKPFKPIFGIRAASMPLKQLLMYIAGILVVVIVLGILIWMLIRTLKGQHKKIAVQAPERKLLPNEIAMMKIAELEKSQLWLREEKNFQTQLTDILRTYLEDQFQVDCFEKTSTEIIEDMKRHTALRKFSPVLKDIFELSDLVKFAKRNASVDEHLQSLKLTREWINETYQMTRQDIDIKTEGQT